MRRFIRCLESVIRRHRKSALGERTMSSKSSDITPSGALLEPITVEAHGTIRRTFAVRHLMAAKHHALAVGEIEKQHAGEPLGPHFDTATWSTTAAIILSFAAIEAALDEAVEDYGLPDNLAAVLERAATLEKAQAFLDHAGKDPFDRGAEPFQPVELLRVIRNGLVHPKAEWDNAKDRNEKITAKIVGAKLPLSPFWRDRSLAFPHGCMSAGTALWATNVAKRFIVEFREKLGLKVQKQLTDGTI